MSIPRIHSAQRIRGIGGKLRMLITVISRDKVGLLFLTNETNFASVKPVKIEPGQLFTRNITTGVTLYKNWWRLIISYCTVPQTYKISHLTYKSVFKISVKGNQVSNISTPSTKFLRCIIYLKTYVKLSANTMEKVYNARSTFDSRGKSKFPRNLRFSWSPWNWSGRGKKRFGVSQLLQCNVRYYSVIHIWTY